MSGSLEATRFPALSLADTRPLGQRPQFESVLGEGTSDEILISQICADNSDALGLLFRRYARLVWTMGFRILRNREEADDLLQDVFLQMRKRANYFDPARGTVRGFLGRIAVQRALTRRRDLAAKGFYTEAQTSNGVVPTGLGSENSYDNGIEAHFGKARVQNAFKELSWEQHETLRLCFVEGHTLDEVAIRLRTTPGNARHYYYRGLDKLRKHLLHRAV